MPGNIHPVVQQADHIDRALREPVHNQMPLHMHIPVALWQLPVMVAALRIILQGTERFV